MHKIKKIILIILLFPTMVFSQNIDTIIVTPIFKSYFSYKTRTPLFVVYKLYKGGGDSSRSGMEFTVDGLKNCADKSDYSHNGYDIGHMANAEDFAYDSEKEKMTFKFYNALPQTPKLNRGCWKKIETDTRKLSQTDSLLIICGGYSFNKKMGKCYVPDYCFKIIKNLNNGTVKTYIFPNDNSDKFTEIKTSDLGHQPNFPRNWYLILGEMLIE